MGSWLTLILLTPVDWHSSTVASSGVYPEQQRQHGGVGVGRGGERHGIVFASVWVFLSLAPMPCSGSVPPGKPGCMWNPAPFPGGIPTSLAPGGQAQVKSMGMREARRIQECTMLLPSPTYVICRATCVCVEGGNGGMRGSRARAGAVRIGVGERLLASPPQSSHMPLNPKSRGNAGRTCLEVLDPAQVFPSGQHVGHDLWHKGKRRGFTAWLRDRGRRVMQSGPCTTRRSPPRKTLRGFRHGPFIPLSPVMLAQSSPTPCRPPTQHKHSLDTGGYSR